MSVSEYVYTQQFTETIIIIAITAVFVLFVHSMIRKYKGSANIKKYQMSIKIWRGVSLLLVFIALFEILAINGIHIGRYVAGLGIASAIAGFALQEPIQDIIMGMTIIAEGRFKIGDVVEYKGDTGKVVKLNLRATWIFLFEEEKTLIVNNREIVEIALASDWFDVDIPIGYDQDLYASRTICRETAKRIERLRYVYSCDFINTQELAESWIVYRVRVHCLPEKSYLVRRNANAVIQDVFYEHDMPFPSGVKMAYLADLEMLGDAEVHSDVRQKSMVEHQMQKADYELGKGAVKSKICAIDGSETAVEKAIGEAERYATAENLGNKMRMRIRLLSEEAISVLHSLTDIKSGQFYIEREGVDYEICLDADANVSSPAHEKLLSVSTSGSNEAYNGISGVIKKAIDTMVIAGRGGGRKRERRRSGNGDGQIHYPK